MDTSLKKNNRDLIFQYKFEILEEIVDTLRSYNYQNIQYIPYQQSYLAFVKEHENLFNYFTKKKSFTILLFTFSRVL